MKGDFTRFTHDPAKGYNAVLRQQGRVDLDADWNEEIEIQKYFERTEAKDVIGRCGIPAIGGGFEIGTHPDVSALELWHVCFADKSKGWTVGYDRVHSEVFRGVILATDNGGQVWTCQVCGIQPSLHGVFFLDGANGWAVGGGATNSRILSTNDGGKNWRTREPGVRQPLYGVWFADESKGWAVGMSGAILTTNDGGESWAPQRSDLPKSHLFGVFFADESKGWVVGFDAATLRGIVLTTDDGGDSWISQTSGVETVLLGVWFVNEFKGWVVGDKGTILKTEDGGESWTPHTSPDGERLIGVCFANESRGWAVGTNASILAYAPDAGGVWTSQHAPEDVTNRLLGVCFSDEETGWAVGSGIVLGTDNGGETWTKYDPPAPNLTISAGRIYVNGMLCENETSCLLTNQPNLSLNKDELPSSEGEYLAYLDVWERHITVVEDPEMREAALGGPDTTTRVATVWQVKLEDVTGVIDPGNPDCSPFCCSSWTPADGLSTAELAARAEVADAVPGPCEMGPDAGYRGLENRLYRVEIHDARESGYVTFKWSRDNGAVVFPIVECIKDGDEYTKVRLERLGRDQELTLRVGDWVEVVGDQTELEGKPGTLAQIKPDGLDEAERIITLNRDVSAHKAETHLKLRRWDQQHKGNGQGQNGAVLVQEDVWRPLEDGVQIRFKSGGVYQTGDYWLIPARTVLRDVLWPKEGDQPVFQPPHGIKHHYCPLALVQLTALAEEFKLLADCRHIFSPLTEIKPGCCVVVQPGENVQRAIDRVIAAGGGCICLCQGVHRVNGPLRLYRARNLTIHGVGEATVLQLNGRDEEGQGGVLLRDCQHVSLERMFVVGEDVPALVTAQAGLDTALNQSVSLRHLTLFNPTGSEDNQSVNCAVRLGHADNIQIESCRLAAATGVVSLIGDRLSDLSEHPLPQSPVKRRTVDFEDLELGTRYYHGNRFTSSNLHVTCESLGSGIVGPYAQVVDETKAGGAGQEVIMISVRLAFDFPSALSGLSLLYGHESPAAPEALKIRINGDERSCDDFTGLSGDTIGGVAVSVTAGFTDDTETHMTGCLDLTGTITDFRIGGERLWIDDVQPPAAGVRELCLRDVQVRHQRYGIWSLRSDNWLLDGCDIGPAALALATGDGDDDSLQRLRQHVDRLFSLEPSTETGTAVKAFIWRDCVVRGCQLSGSRGLEICDAIRGRVTDNVFQVGERAAHASWLHDAEWARNRVRCGEAAFSFAGCYRARVEGNHVRGRRGLVNANVIHVLNDLWEDLVEVVDFYERPFGPIENPDDYEIVSLWLLLDELVRLLGLRGLLYHLQQLLNLLLGFSGPTGLARLPVLLLVSTLLHKLVNRKAREPTLPALLIALRLDDNDVETDEECVLLENFVPLGGMGVRRNRLRSVNGDGLHICANTHAAHVHLNVYLLRWGWYVAKALVQSMAAIPDRDRFPNLSEIRQAWRNVLAVASELLERWERQSETFLEADYRVESNAIRSLGTAIESNLFELAILNNHMTVVERPTSNQEAAAMVNALAGSPLLAPLATAVRDGSKWNIDRVSRRIMANKELLENPHTRAETSKSVRSVAARISDSRMIETTTNLGDAIDATDTHMLDRWRSRLVELLNEYTSGYGIQIKGAGCRIVGNHVLVPIDLDPDTWGPGGIRFRADDPSLVWLWAFLVESWEWLEYRSQAPLLGITETLVEDNEVIGGSHHGIEIQGIAWFSDRLRSLPHVTIRGNRIRGMAGAGILIDEAAVNVGVNIIDNRIDRCSTILDLASLTDHKGGLIVHNATLCRIRDNRIQNCGNVEDGDPAKGIFVWAIDIDQVWDVAVTRNHLLHRGRTPDYRARDLGPEIRAPSPG